jgi:hypothetical protein
VKVVHQEELLDPSSAEVDKLLDVVKNLLDQWNSIQKEFQPEGELIIICEK